MHAKLRRMQSIESCEVNHENTRRNQDSRSDQRRTHCAIRSRVYDGAYHRVAVRARSGAVLEMTETIKSEKIRSRCPNCNHPVETKTIWSCKVPGHRHRTQDVANRCIKSRTQFEINCNKKLIAGELRIVRGREFLSLRHSGWSYRKIGELYGIGITATSRIIKRAQRQLDREVHKMSQIL